MYIVTMFISLDQVHRSLMSNKTAIRALQEASRSK